MGTLSLTNPVNGTTADATLVTTNNAAIKAVVNGGIDDSNIAPAAAIAVSKIAGYPSDATKFLNGAGAWTVPGTTLASGQGGDITAASTINVDHVVHRVSGATQIQQITANGTTPVGGLIVTLISVGGAITYNSNANILATGAGSTRAVPQHTAVTLVYDGTLGNWNVAGVGS